MIEGVIMQGERRKLIMMRRIHRRRAGTRRMYRSETWKSHQEFKGYQKSPKRWHKAVEKKQGGLDKNNLWLQTRRRENQIIRVSHSVICFSFPHVEYCMMTNKTCIEVFPRKTLRSDTDLRPGIYVTSLSRTFPAPSCIALLFRHLPLTLIEANTSVSVMTHPLFRSTFAMLFSLISKARI